MRLNFIQRINLLIYAAAVAFFTFIMVPMNRIGITNQGRAIFLGSDGFRPINYISRESRIMARIDPVRLAVILVGITLATAAIHLMFSGRIEMKKHVQS